MLFGERIPKAPTDARVKKHWDGDRRGGGRAAGCQHSAGTTRARQGYRCQSSESPDGPITAGRVVAEESTRK
jgi:hypothetical protein